MQRNWYVLCVQKNQEKKVAALLTKKGIENFCPFSITVEKEVSRSSKKFGPLFKSYVFVNICETDIQQVKKIPTVINTLYWQSKPAVINDAEINAIKMLVDNYSTIQLKKTIVNHNDSVGVTERSIAGYHNNLMSVKHMGMTVNLPSLGYTLVTERENPVSILAKEKKSLPSISLIKRINPLYLFGY